MNTLFRACSLCAVAFLSACGGGSSPAPVTPPVQTVPPVQTTPAPVHAEIIAGVPGRPDGFADGTGTAARFNNIVGFGVDKAGNYYVADSNHCAIRKITPAHVVTTLAGVGGQCGDVDGAGAAARLNEMVAMTQDGAGNLYVAENTAVRKVTLDGVVSTVAGAPGTRGKVDGSGSAALFWQIQGIAMAPDGNLLVSDGQQYWGTLMGNVPAGQENTVRRVTPLGVVTTLPESVTAGATLAPMAYAGDLRYDASGNLYFVTAGVLAKRAPDGAVTRLSDDKGNAVSMGMPLTGQSSMRVTPDDAGNVFYTVFGRVYKYGSDHAVTLVLAPAGANVPVEATVDVPFHWASAVTYLGSQKFLMSFDNQVVLVTLK